MRKILITILSLSLIAVANSAQAHISITPGVSAAGSSTEAITAGKSGVLNFRIGHGCTLAKETTNPATKLSMVGTAWGTKSFSVDIPLVAQGTGASIPRPAWVPGWTAKVTKDAATSVYTVKWTSISRAFDIPDSPEGDTGAKYQFDFAVRVTWAAAAAGTVYFKSVQTCQVNVPGVAGVKATKTKPAVKAIKARSFDIFNSWDVTDGSGADTVADEIEHNTAPSVSVIPAA